MINTSSRLGLHHCLEHKVGTAFSFTNSHSTTAVDFKLLQSKVFDFDMASQYDIIIVGGGPAGLSAAASIVRQDHKMALFDSGKYRNAESKHMHTVPTWDHRDPAELRLASLRDLLRYGTVTIEQIEVKAVKKNEDRLFEATAGGKTSTGKKLILATGVQDVFPDIPGYAECWISGMDGREAIPLPAC